MDNATTSDIRRYRDNLRDELNGPALAQRRAPIHFWMAPTINANKSGGAIRLIHTNGLSKTPCHPIRGTHTLSTRSSVPSVHSPLTNAHSFHSRELAR